MARTFVKSQELQALEDAEIRRLLDSALMYKSQAAIMRDDSPVWAAAADRRALYAEIDAYHLADPEGARFWTVALSIFVVGFLGILGFHTLVETKSGNVLLKSILSALGVI